MLTDDRKKTVSTLKGLIEICKDGEEGFKTASDNIKDAEYKTALSHFSQQRAMFARELEAEVRRLGSDNTINAEGFISNVTGVVHRGWINIKSVVSKGDAEAIFNECERGEDSAMRAFETALEDKTLPMEVLQLVRSQYVAVKEAHDRVKSLRNLERA